MLRVLLMLSSIIIY